MFRPSREDIIVEYTKLIATRGTCNRAHVGCVIERDGRPLSVGYNGAEPGASHCLDVGCKMEDGHCVRTIHAEANAIAWAARNGIAIEGATLYTYGWKGGVCDRCLKLAISAGIHQIKEITKDNQVRVVMAGQRRIDS